MSETPSEQETGLDRMLTSLVAFTGCIGEALDEVCSYSLTVGESYVPFDPDPDDDCPDEDAACTQAWVRVMNVAPTYKEPSFDDGDCASVMRLTLEVGILRCFDLDEDGEAPSATQVMASALQSMTDMNAIYCAAMECEVWDSIESGTWVPNGPLGGQYGGIWTFDVEV